tara:strand:- start:722 stop:1075 length:354 start_codon:yes stop_codon:yes gene_type:complete
MDKELKIHIICEKNKIKKLLQDGACFKTRYLIFYYLKDQNFLYDLSFLISVPKKKIKLAIHRNYLKRIFKSFIYNEKKKILTELNTKISFIAVYNHTSKIKYTKLEEDILFFLTKFK